METREEMHQGLVKRAREIGKLSGWKVWVTGLKTRNERYVQFMSKDGRRFSVWLPADGRVNDGELKDMEEALDEIALRPELRGVRGADTCYLCGGRTKSVLDGEAWCPSCQRYQ